MTAGVTELTVTVYPLPAIAIDDAQGGLGLFHLLIALWAAFQQCWLPVLGADCLRPTDPLDKYLSADQFLLGKLAEQACYEISLSLFITLLGRCYVTKTLP